MVNDGSTRNVDERCRWFHKRQPSRVDEMACFGGKRTRQHNKVGLFDKSVEQRKRSAQLLFEFNTASAIAIQDLHLEPERSPCHLGSNAAAEEATLGEKKFSSTPLSAPLTPCQ
jgi:hypothetical protein